ncbi:MAG TPA: hypothetical protein GX716_00670 [Firmicutes bacterium]|nr:hypothetical protein [Candidatus Fermentithermobacillaceae bacterium]
MTLEERLEKAMEILALGAGRYLEAKATRVPQPVTEEEGGSEHAGKSAIASNSR